MLSAVSWLAVVAAYLTDYHRSGPAVLRAREFIHYILIYFGERWFRTGRYEDGPVVAASLLCFTLLTVRALRNRKEVSGSEWFLIAEGGLAILSACVTAAGRLQSGVGQAHAARYQTVALLYWSSFFALALVSIWRWRPSVLKSAQLVLLAILLLSIDGFPGVWRMRVAEADSLRAACTAVMSEHYTKEQASKLFPAPEQLGQAINFLRERWGAAHKRKRE